MMGTTLFVPGNVSQKKEGSLRRQCHLDNDIGQRAKKTDYQKKVVSFSLPEKGKHSRHTKQTDAFICEKNVYNKIVIDQSR